MDAKTPVLSKQNTMASAVVLFIFCLAWSSLIWLHEQGLRHDREVGPTPPPGPPADLLTEAEHLPKIPRQADTLEEDD